MMPSSVDAHDAYKRSDLAAARIMGWSAAEASPSDVMELVWSLDPKRKAAYICTHGASKHRGKEVEGSLWTGGDNDLFMGRGRGKNLKPDFADIIHARCAGCGLVEWGADPANELACARLLQALTESKLFAELAGSVHGDADNHRMRREGYQVILELLNSSSAARS
ncbi:unnamed protein product [Polarella glacialis]|uniref:Uncharacterized protein n=1 Tax=Polarella glacialis TaxID=89957 RepID=A0A813K5D3_POLGL|nr:unnamed protein product [Polarella glacialis]